MSVHTGDTARYSVILKPDGVDFEDASDTLTFEFTADISDNCDSVMEQAESYIIEEKVLEPFVWRKYWEIGRIKVTIEIDTPEVDNLKRVLDNFLIDDAQMMGKELEKTASSNLYRIYYRDTNNQDWNMTIIVLTDKQVEAFKKWKKKMKTRYLPNNASKKLFDEALVQTVGRTGIITSSFHNKQSCHVDFTEIAYQYEYELERTIERLVDEKNY